MISKRVQGFTESVIREMTRVNNQYDGINLAQGMPNFSPPRELLEAALILGVAHVTLLDFPDGSLDELPDGELAQRIDSWRYALFGQKLI